MSIHRSVANQILMKIRKGDEKSKNDLVREFFNRLKGVASKHVRNQNDVDEVVLDSFMRAFTYIDTFEPEKDGYNWLCRIVQRVAYDFNKKDTQWESLDEPLLYIDYSENELSPEDYIILRDEIERWIHLFNEQDQRLLRLRYWDRLTYEEVGKSMGLKLSTTYKRENRIFDVIRKKQKKEEKLVKKFEEK